jgi:hypothetical protein
MLTSLRLAEKREQVSPKASSSPVSKYVDKTSPWEEGVLELLRTTNNPDTIGHICRLPFRDRDTPQVTLSDRWDSRLDSFLISFAARDRYNEVLEWTRDHKAKELLQLLRPVVRRRPPVWDWSWTPPTFASQDSRLIAKGFHDTIYAAVHRVTFQEWVSYVHGNEEHAVTSLLNGVWTSRHSLYHGLMMLSRGEREKYMEVEEVSLCSDTLYCEILIALTAFAFPTPSSTLDSC